MKAVGDPHLKDSDASPELGPDPDVHFDSDPILAFHSDADPHPFFYRVIFCDFFGSMYCVQHCFICRPSDSTVSADAGIEPRTVWKSALAVIRSNH